MTELGEIPQQWEIVTLENLCEKMFVGIATSTCEYYTNNGVPIIRNQNIKEDYLNTNDLLMITHEFSVANKSKKLKVGDILTVRTGYPGISCVVPKEFENAQTFTTLISRPDSNRVVPQYLCRFINSELGKKAITSVKAGGAQQNLNVSVFSKIKIVTPTLPEQLKIADILSTVDKQLEQTDALIEKTKKLKAGLMQKLLTKGIGHTEFKQTEIGEIPVEWVSINTEEILLDKKGAIKIGPFGSQLKKNILVDKGVKVYGQENVFQNDFSIGDRYITSDKFDELRTCELKSGDIIISMMGTVGKCVIAPDNIEKGIMDSHLLRLQIDAKKFCKEFLMQLVSESQIVYKQIKKLSVGGIMEGLSSYIIKQLKYPCPPIPEQQKIARILFAIDKQIIQYEDKYNKLNILKRSLMQKLLTGKMRVVMALYPISKSVI